MSRARLLAAISLIVALAVALVVVLFQQGSSDRSTSEAVSAARPPAEPVAAPPPEPVPVPTPDNTGRDFNHIWREIRRFADWTYTQPGVGVRHIELIYHPDCPCYEEVRRALSGLVEDGVHFEDSGFVVEDVVVTSDLGEAVRIETRMSVAPQRLVNAQGITVQSDEGLPSRDFAVNLELQSNGRWLARSISLIEP